jgi:hypothetical protein
MIISGTRECPNELEFDCLGFAQQAEVKGSEAVWRNLFGYVSKLLEEERDRLKEDTDWAGIKDDIRKIRDNNETGEIVLKYVHGVLKQHYYTKSTFHNKNE